jgi:hypothetical protein
LLLAVDELYYDAFITDAPWNALAKRYNQQQLRDLVVTVGQDNLLSMFLNSFACSWTEARLDSLKAKINKESTQSTKL